MSSYRRIQASRRNGSKSRGPTTPEGKQHSSGNATTHGLLSDCIVLPGESREGFDALLDEYLARFGPRDGVELSIIEEMTACYWRMRRAWSIENGLLKEGITSQTSGDSRTRIIASFRGLAASPDLALLHRYEARLH